LNGSQKLLPGAHGSDESRAAYDRLVAEFLNGGRTLPAVQPTEGPTIINVCAAFWRHTKAFYVDASGTPTGEADNYRPTIAALRRLSRLHSKQLTPDDWLSAPARVGRAARNLPVQTGRNRLRSGRDVLMILRPRWAGVAPHHQGLGAPHSPLRLPPGVRERPAPSRIILVAMAALHIAVIAGLSSLWR
jgi:hypothetical protein